MELCCQNNYKLACYFIHITNNMIQQKVDYIHYNPVEAGFVNQPQEWRLSSANEQSAIKLDERI